VTEPEKIRALVDYRLEQAAEAVTAAELNLANGLARSAVNRAYYGMFYAVLALLAARQTETSRHSGAIGLFDQLFVKPALFRPEFSRWLHDAFLRRQAVDYGAELALSRDEIDTLLTQARAFLDGVRRYLTEHPPGATRD
jgi:uncharacterized protein (UPF0332 family)